MAYSMPYEELKGFVLAMVKCQIGAEAFANMEFDDEWLKAIHQDKNENRNETVLAYDWINEYNKRNQANLPLPPTVQITPLQM